MKDEHATGKTHSPSQSKSVPAKNEFELENAIRERAYHLWEKAGKPHGRDVDFWLRAKKELQK